MEKISVLLSFYILIIHFGMIFFFDFPHNFPIGVVHTNASHLRLSFSCGTENIHD